MTQITIKQGATFAPNITVTQSVGGPAQSLTGWVIDSHVRTARGSLVDTLDVEDRNDAAGTYTLRAPDGTAAWPVDQLEWDIRYTKPDGDVLPTETIVLNVQKRVTV